MPPASALHERIEALLARRKENGNLRSLASPPYDPSKLVDFSSNDYISLAKSPVLQDSLRNIFLQSPPSIDSGSSSQEASGASTSTLSPTSLAILSSASTSKLPSPLPYVPYGPASSRLLDGNSPAHLLLESQLASFFQGPAGLLFNSGFDANSGVFACLPTENDAVLYDEYIHASTHDGMRHSRTKRRRAFKHNSLQDLERQLNRLVCEEDGEGFRSGKDQIFVAVEALYSMDGDLAPLTEMLDIIERVLPNGNGHLIVDEAHSTGLYGEQGRGLTCALGLQDRVLIRLHTFGKAFACSGGLIVCSPQLRDYFINYARPLIYSTVMPQLLVSAISCSLSHLQAGFADDAIARLHRLTRYCHRRLHSRLTSSASITLPSSNPPSASSIQSLTSPIIPIVTNQPRILSAYLIKNGYLVRPIAYPTVPKGEERVRICLHACNTEEQIDGLVDALERWSTPSEAPTMEESQEPPRPYPHPRLLNSSQSSSAVLRLAAKL